MYLYYSSGETGTNLLARVRADGNLGGPPETIFEGLPVSPYHDGGDLAFGPDGMLYLALGEGHDPDRAQDPNDPGGKILRLSPDGSIPDDNPFGSGNPAWSMGHRNSFGLCFDPATGNLWETENGPSGHDEVNLIRPGGNYGWPETMGGGGPSEFEDPAIDFPETIVPTGCAIYTAPHLGRRSIGALFFGDFGGTLHRAVLSMHGAIVVKHAPFVRDLPGITDVAMGPDERLYVATEESILRLPARFPEPAPSPRPGPTPSGTGTAVPEPLPTVPSSEGSGLRWLVWALGGIVLIGGALLAARRSGR